MRAIGSDTLCSHSGQEVLVAFSWSSQGALEGERRLGWWIRRACRKIVEHAFKSSSLGNKLRNDCVDTVSKLVIEEVGVSFLRDDHVSSTSELDKNWLKSIAAHVSRHSKVSGSNWGSISWLGLFSSLLCIKNRAINTAKAHG